MSQLLAYSGICTKIRGMKAKLFTDRMYQELAESVGVDEAFKYLEEKESYKMVFKNVTSGEKLHRGDVEKILYQSFFADFKKLYLFANREQKKFLNFYKERYTAKRIKEEIRANSHHLPEYIDTLKGTIYYKVLYAMIIGNSELGAHHFDNVIDGIYYAYIWKKKDKIFDKEDAKIIEAEYGSKIDALNLECIYRAKKYYKIPTQLIPGFLIPVNYKLKVDQMTELIHAPDADSFKRMLVGTRFEAYSEAFEEQGLEFSGIMNGILNRLSASIARKNPYSIGSIYNYLYMKEKEIGKLITIIEGVRYSLNPEEILKYTKQS